MKKKIVFIPLLIILLISYLTFSSLAAVTYYEIEEMETTSGWSYTTNWSLSTTRKEGNYSMRIEAYEGAGQELDSKKTFNQSFPSGVYEWHLTFWFRVNSLGGSRSYTGFSVGIKEETGAHTYWLVGFKAKADNTQYFSGILIEDQFNAGLERHTLNSTTMFDLNTWYSFRLFHNQPAGQVTLYYSLDGYTNWQLCVNATGLETTQSITPEKWVIIHQEYQNEWIAHVDYMRVSDIIPEPPPPPPPYERVYNIRYIFGLIGLAMIVIAPTYGIWEIKNNKNYMAILTAFVLAAIGYAFVVVWLAP